MDNLEEIERYFSQTPDGDLARQFEEKISSNPVFAEEVAFYLSAFAICKNSSAEEKKEHFREIYKYRPVSRSMPVQKWIYYLAAAAVITGILLGAYIFFQRASPKEVAKNYVQNNLKTLGITMSGHKDSLQIGIRLYNEAKFDEALTQFETILQTDTSNYQAYKYAGLAALQLGEYDKALNEFKILEKRKDLYANPALLYQSMTLMERNQSGDIDLAKQLLQQIVKEDLEGKEIAEDWLKKL